MSDQKVKAAVRARDRHQCRKCGMTEDAHLAKHETDLHVHRLIPGAVYEEEWCVTLCSGCHGGFPKQAERLIFTEPEETGVVVLLFNLFNAVHAQIWAELVAEANRRKENPSLTAERWLAERAESLPHDFQI